MKAYRGDGGKAPRILDLCTDCGENFRIDTDTHNWKLERRWLVGGGCTRASLNVIMRKESGTSLLLIHMSLLFGPANFVTI